MGYINFLKHFDLFKRPVKIYFTKSAKKEARKKYQVSMGSYIGTLLTFCVVSITVTFFVYEYVKLINGKFDDY